PIPPRVRREPDTVRPGALGRGHGRLRALREGAPSGGAELWRLHQVCNRKVGAAAPRVRRRGFLCHWYDAPMADPSRPLRGRGAPSNPGHRFERLTFEPDPSELTEEDLRALQRTRYVRDASRSVISHNTSPDIPFDSSLNPYRGCEHGCGYCYAR